MDCKCKNNLERSCYICSNVVLPNYQAKITNFVKKAYYDYFEVRLGDQDKPFAPHVCCKTCGELEGLEEWEQEEYAICHSNDLKGKKRSHYRLLFLHDISKRNELQEQTPCPIP